MGIVERELANCELSDGTPYRIELNRNGRIHIHIGIVRIDMTIEEFTYFTNIIVEAKSNLITVKEIEE